MKPLTLKLIAAEPFAHDHVPAFVDGPGRHGVEYVRVPRYVISTQATLFAGVRREREIGLRDAAKRLGLKSAAEVSSLETGKLTLSLADWQAALTAILSDSEGATDVT